MACHRITPENARHMAALSWAARQRRAQERLHIETDPTPTPAPAADYAARRLLRVRQHLDRLDWLLSKETDALVLERMARALSHLAEQERLLCGRPLPGQYRPEIPRESKPQTALSWPVPT